MPEDDEVLRASVFLLEKEPEVGDGYSSDNNLFYGKITVSKTTDHKTTYLQKLGKQILSNPQSEMTQIGETKAKTKTLYTALTKRLNEEENELHIISDDDSMENVRREERERKNLIHARYALPC